MADDQGTATAPDPAPPMPPMPPPPPAAAPPAEPTNAFAVTSLVLGIVSVVLFWTIWLPFVSGTLAVVFGALGRTKAKEGAPNEGMATAGLVLGIVGLVASVIFLVLFLTVIQERITTQIFDIVRNR